jgi:monoamine oxidase
MSTPSPPTDVLVVGAGLAGLYAAREIAARGRSVRVLEARDRVGGRTWTVQLEGSPFDAGGQWTGPAHRRLYGLVSELGLRTEATFHSGRKLLELEGELSTYTSSIPRISVFKLLRMQLAIWRIEWLCRKVPLRRPWTAPEARSWDGLSVADYLHTVVRDPDVVALTNSAARVIFGADIEDICLLHFLHYLHAGGGLTALIETHGGNQDSSVVGGAQQLCEGMARGLEVVLEAPAEGVVQDEHGVEVHTPKGSFKARRAILALPTPLVDRLRFEPELPASRKRLQAHTHMGHTVKCQVLYERPFWREAGFSGEAVCTRGPLNVVFDGMVGGGHPALLVFVTGRPAQAWRARTAEERRELLLETLVSWFGPEAGRPVQIRETDWSDERYSGGAPVVLFQKGALTRDGEALRAPVGGIHWAGTETALEFTGFMEGALESGERAAREVLAELA